MMATKQREGDSFYEVHSIALRIKHTASPRAQREKQAMHGLERFQFKTKVISGHNPPERINSVRDAEYMYAPS
jgi:hypothetical protein